MGSKAHERGLGVKGRPQNSERRSPDLTSNSPRKVFHCRLHARARLRLLRARAPSAPTHGAVPQNAEKRQDEPPKTPTRGERCDQEEACTHRGRAQSGRSTYRGKLYRNDAMARSSRTGRPPVLQASGGVGQGSERRPCPSYGAREKFWQ